MKLLMIIVDTNCREELAALLHRADIVAYSEIPNARGVGESGVRMGSAAHPRTSSIFFTVIDEGRVAELKETILSYCEACAKTMKMILWSVEEIV